MAPAWAVTLVRDEVDIIEGSLAHMAGEGVAGIVVADNGSTDGTREILAGLELDCELVVLDDPDPAHYQGRKMTALAAVAANKGADWIIPFDADELWYGTDRLAVVLESIEDDVARAVLFNHLPTALDSPDPDPFRALGWRDRTPLGLAKVAFRWRDGVAVDEGNHGVTYANQRAHAVTAFEIRHFPYRSADQFVAKALRGAAALAATDLPEDVGAHWRQYGRLAEAFGPDILRGVFREHFWHLTPVDDEMVFDPAPYLRWS